MKGQILEIDCNDSYGNTGEFAFRYNEEDYCVGDVVKIKVGATVVERYVVKKNGEFFVMGSRNATLNGNEEGLKRRDVKKLKSYTKLKDGEQYRNLFVRLINENRRIIQEVK